MKKMGKKFLESMC